MPKIGQSSNKTLTQALMEETPPQLNDDLPHVLVKARAGTGKTFTLMAGVCWAYRNRIPNLWRQLISRCGGKEPLPSEEQLKVWQEMERSVLEAKTICFMAFGNKVVQEFGTNWDYVVRLLKAHGKHMEFRTTHSLGYRMCHNNLRLSQRLNDYRVQDTIIDIMGHRPLRDSSEEGLIYSATAQLVNLFRFNLLPTDVEDEEERRVVDGFIEELMEQYQIIIDDEGTKRKVMDLVPRVVEQMRDTTNLKEIDNLDMIWLPIVKGWEGERYGLVLGDEVQDWNACQRELVVKCSERAILVGDDCQAIFGFAGADFNSMNNIRSRFKNTKRGLLETSLTVTRRCPKSVVALCQRIVPDLKAMDDAPEGIAINLQTYPFTRNGYSQFTARPFGQTYMVSLLPGDLVLARSYQPLVSNYMYMIRQGIGCRLLGKDVGSSLIALAHEVGGTNVHSFLQNLDFWRDHRRAKELTKPHPSNRLLEDVEDKYQVLRFIIGTGIYPDEHLQGGQHFNSIISRLESLFQDTHSSACVTLSTVHQAKGMEADNVYILSPHWAPLPSRKQGLAFWEQEQEKFLEYVAMTRTKSNLYRVS